MPLLRSVLSLVLPLSVVPASVAARFHVEVIPNSTSYTLDIFNLPNFGPSVAYEYPLDPESPLSPYPVIYDDGKILPVPATPAGLLNYSFASSNNLGEFVGSSTRLGPAGYVFGGVVYKNGKWTATSYPLGAVNDKGDTLGGDGSATYLNVNGKVTSIGIPPGYPAGSFIGAVGLNNVDQIAANLVYNDPTRDHTAPVFYANGRWVNLPQLPNQFNSYVIGLNQAGVVLENWTDDPTDIGVVVGHAALLTTKSYKDIGQLPGGSYLQATALDDFGDVVGQALQADDRYDGFLYSNGVMEDLNDLVDTAEYYVGEPTAINDFGHIAVMMYRKSNFDPVPAILVPICPSSLGSAGPQPASAEELQQNAQWCRASASVGAR